MESGVSRKRALSASSIFRSVGIALTFVALAANANDRTQFRHGISFFGDFKYPPDFAHFDFVNPDAPKGGRVVYGMRGTFDSFTPLIRKGIRPAGMAIVGKWQFLYDRLLEYSDDEAGVHYSRLAESIAVSEDFTRVRVRLRTNAYWHDGAPITVKDVLGRVRAPGDSGEISRGFSRHVVDRCRARNAHQGRLGRAPGR